jgi:S-formylglutathione hydrolase FrmB
MLKRLFILLFALFSIASYAAQVDTVSVPSRAMNKSIKTVVITPDGYGAKGAAYPVVYLLHGYSGNYADWVKNASSTVRQADLYRIIIVCPDGGFSSWYFDSPVDKTFQYETHVAGEVVEWVDKNYNTIRDRSGRAITGLSMGGHGALYLALKHQDVFGAAGSTSGGVDLRPFPKNWDIAKRIGTYATQPRRWEEMSVINMLHLLEPGSLHLIVDCGTGDFFYPVNKNLHQTLLDRNIPHEYVERPGAHNWEYWNNSVQYQMLFFSNVLKRGGQQ